MRKTPLTLGVLAIIFGGAVALYDGGRLALTSAAGTLNKTFGAAMANAPRAPGQPDPSIMMAKAETLQKELAPYTMSLLGAMVLFSLVLIAIGIGLYKRKPWARSAAIAWSALGLVFLAADAIVHFSVILPRSQAMMKEMFATMPNADKVAGMMQVVGGAQNGIIVLQEVCLAVFPILLIILCGRRSAAADFVD